MLGSGAYPALTNWGELNPNFVRSSCVPARRHEIGQERCKAVAEDRTRRYGRNQAHPRRRAQEGHRQKEGSEGDRLCVHVCVEKRVSPLFVGPVSVTHSTSDLEPWYAYVYGPQVCGVPTPLRLCTWIRSTTLPH